MTRVLPSGTVTLLFTDIAGSTRLLQELGRERYVRALTEHRHLLREAFTGHGGVEVEMQGDSFHFAFPSASGAVAAAAAGQRALAAHEWESEPIRVRIGLHTGEPVEADGLYAGLDVHRAARVMSAAHGGQILVSQSTAALVDGELASGLVFADLGEHRLKDLVEPEHLFQLLGDGLEVEFPPLETATGRSRLPLPPTPLVGRERELEELSLLLASRERRILTLTGPGGSGKTRLALAAAERAHGSFRNGARFISLGGLTDAELLAGAVAHGLDLKERKGEPLAETIAAALADQELLLCLDNLEQLLPAAATFVARLIENAPHLVVLVTSRAPLRVHREGEYHVPPLDPPDAVALFCARAQSARPSFGDESAPDVAGICARVDYLPLALELAAARLRLLSPKALLARLEHALPLLSDGDRDLPARQRTLAGTIAWSYDLLSPDEQRLFRRASVFVDGFTFEAAQEVCGPDDDLAFLTGLESLVEQSLLRAGSDADGELRFRMLQVIREFAEERLHESGELDAMRALHAGYYLSLAVPEDDGVPAALGPSEQVRWLDRLQADRDNVRAALSWSLDRPSRELVRFGYLGWWFWYMRGPLAEGREWLERILTVTGGVDGDLRSRVLRGAGTLALNQGDHAAGKALLEESIDVARQQGDSADAARSLHNLGLVELSLQEYRRARELLQESVELLRDSPEPSFRPRALANLGIVALALGERDEAAAALGESLEIYRETGEDASDALGTMAALALDEGDPVRAAHLAREALALDRRIGHELGIVECIERIAVARALLGDWTQSARLLAAAASGRELLGAPRFPYDEPRIQQALDLAAEACDRAALMAAEAEGRELTLEQAAELAETVSLKTGAGT